MNTTIPDASATVIKYNALRYEYRQLMHNLNTSTSAVSNILHGIDDSEPNDIERIGTLRAAYDFAQEKIALATRIQEITSLLCQMVVDGADKEAAQFSLDCWTALNAKRLSTK